MPQLAAVGHGPEDAFRRMGGKPFAIDVKFDGDRIQVGCKGVLLDCGTGTADNTLE